MSRFMTVSGAALLALLSVGCTKTVNEEISHSGGIPKLFRAGSDPVTRTQLTEDNAVLWESGDAVSLFDRSGSCNRFTTEDSGESAAFSGTVSVDGGPYYALYPYDGNAEIDGSVISTVLPAVQTARAGGFASGLNPAVARADENEMLYFRNACPIVKFTLGGSAAMVVRAVLQGNLGESLAGAIAVDASFSDPSASLAASGETKVELEGKFEPGSTYCFVVAPGTLSGGLSVTLYDESGKAWSRHGDSAVTLEAGRALNLGILEPDVFVPESGYELEGGTYHIYGRDGLEAWASDPAVLTCDVVLEADLDMSGTDWVPVGTGMDSGYAGDFDGGGKTIAGLTVTSGDNAGFFGGLASGAKVHDLSFSEAQVTGTGGNSSAGVIAGASLGVIEDCNVVSSEVSGQYAGAVTGNNSVQVNCCDAVGVSVTGTFSAGGIAGLSYGKIEYCTLSGESRIVASGGSSRAGGIVGSTSEEGGVKTSGRVLKCAVEGAFISGLWAGGIAGENGFGIIAQCVVDDVTLTHAQSGSSARLGGIAGYNSRGDVVASYSAYSEIGAEGLVSEAEGGVVGYNNYSSANVYGCYSTHVSLLGEVSGPESGKGSIAGYTNGHVVSCYAVLPENVSGISLVGNGKNAPEHCVEAGGSNYDVLITDVPDLKAPDGSVWVAEEIWDITAGGAPAIVSDYISDPPAAGE